jgi:superfamily II DNA or RNA helicase
MDKDGLLTRFEREARKWLAEGRVGDIDFAGRTYQVQVVEPTGAEFWPFLQFGLHDELIDAFCTCDTAEKYGSCPHLATALLRLYKELAEPLHVRFQRSFWNQLCWLFGERQGYSAEILELAEAGCYRLLSVTGKQLFAVRARTPTARTRLEVIIERRVPETEENSLKFSGLTMEELVQWREGRPSKALQYELSLWSDLAKWLFLLQEGGADYLLRFQSEPSALPHGVVVEFGELAVEFYLSRANLPLLIPSLPTVKSPLAVYQAQEEAIGEITYDRSAGSLHLGQHESALHSRHLRRQAWHNARAADHLTVDGWLYSPGDGFYARADELLARTSLIDQEHVAAFLDTHTELADHHLIGEHVHTERLTLQYQLWFDAQWQLHIQAYVFEPGDLQSAQSRSFGRWIYLEDDGFYPINSPPFPDLHLTVPPADLPEFIRQNRPFLNEHRAFTVHLTALQAPLTYGVNEHKALFFLTAARLPEETETEAHHFDDWIYVKGEGFFARQRPRPQSPLRPGVAIPEQEVALFIRSNQEDLELIPGFFAERCPVAATELKVELTGSSAVAIRPQYRLHAEYQRRTVLFFGEYAYVAGEGFSPLPRHLLPPDRFRTTQLLRGQELQLFLTYELESLLPRIAELDPRLRRPAQLELVASDPEQIEEGHGLIPLQLAYQSQQGMATLPELWRAQSQRQRYAFTAAGLIDLQDPQLKWLRGISASRLDKRRNILRLSSLEVIRLQAMEGLVCAPDAVRTREFLERLSTSRAPTTPILEGFKSQLRPYQQLGLEWLWFLHSQGLSGLLCDDMGLGKTHQAMALISAISALHRDRAVEEHPNYLVVCPTSVLYHWKEKVGQYLPHIRLHLFHGAGRLLPAPAEYDLLLTSYGVLRSEEARMSRFTFGLAVFDEIQIAKNPSSRTHQALSRVRSHMRLGLTGTPIENNLRELKSLFDLVVPGYLPPEPLFREQFVGAVDEATLHRLRRLVRPFILRRRKEEVLTELPGKIEERAHCELSAQQRDLYHQVLARSRDPLVAELEDAAKPVNYVHIFSILTALKRICDHPAVYLKEPQNYQQYESGKWGLFCELLAQARDSGQKVVVFSQYLDMLDIIEAYLRQSGIGHAGIRGSTSDREEQLIRFAQDPRCEVFVGSLGAAGLGIDLKSASVVIHYDRWWTRAREDQATDRVYRMGQTRGVQVFKLLTIGTIDDKIDQIIERKGELMESVVSADDAGQLKSFTRQELIELLSLSV